MIKKLLGFICTGTLCTACISGDRAEVVLSPISVTAPVLIDTDDPAIWIDRGNPSASLVLGTDKGDDDRRGGLYAFDLSGRRDSSRYASLDRPNNVDVAYGLKMTDKETDIAVCTERNTNSIRVFSLPDFAPIDGGGIPVFVGDSLRAPMGLALYCDMRTNDIYAIVGRKDGPQEGYLHQYLLTTDTPGVVVARLVRKFGKFSGRKEIEAIVVDNELGYVYYSDEGLGVRKYYAHPDSSGAELAIFAQTGVSDDHEGLSIYKADDGTGYILLSDQGANQFHVFPREGTQESPHDHPLVKVVRASTQESDGNEVTSVALNDTFRYGLFVAMSDDGTFHYYRWEDIAGQELFLAPDGDKR